ncbi:MarR family winged helix-turn-helix transcriptional regulator [Pantoea ananatis]|jgi:MarR family transcriptional regulator for hemolysin|uniref:MarR family winged helix-turn-helix transcriptional regulator n=1 Tax=Pantoea ananas TaxID=553 RepID=UPI000241736D|nr:MarR family transcriptional regulator [Pantoea ananatis]MBA4822257.1 MarR family transcriptional regulator [Pantoea ananatis]MCW1833899.1 MarR family transcriptional regulator [Pantoea ananatis]MDJ0033092.1 MarR family transcriptional regulator [Pantoea ananatis]MDJ0046342.1 MarR family transcriptional regulator [Pantoea ananatis]NCU09368.1 MarR family transcriptional regulator [Pantoea ananatis]
MSSTRTFTHLLHLTAHAWRLAVDRHLKDSGLSTSSWMAIGLIASEPQRLTQTELAQRMGLEDASMVPLVDRLVKQDLLTRVQPAEDRRKRHLVLTEKGNEAFANVKTHADALRAELLADIDPQELAVVERILETLLTRMGTM